MTSSAPKGSYTPGPKTYGLEARRRRRRPLGSSFRDAGTWKPSGSRGVAMRSMCAAPLLVLVVAVAGLGTLALVRRRFGFEVGGLFHVRHNAEARLSGDIRPIN